MCDMEEVLISLMFRKLQNTIAAGHGRAHLAAQQVVGR